MDQKEILSRGVKQILPSKKDLSDLMAKKKITLYQGFDPSSPSLHIGNLIGIRKLSQFQKLGHKVVFLIGDFTGMIGDPTDKSATRKKLSHKEVLKNAKDYKKQVEKFLDFEGPNKAEIRFNSDWLSKLSFADLVELSSNFTVQQLLERDFFQQRLKEGKPIHLHEFLYPIMQGYDSVFLGVDLEVGGNDQLFNMLAGRTLLKTLKNKEKFVLTLKLLEDPTGKKMGKSEGNTINLTDSPNDIFGKIMSLPDSLIDPLLELLTNLSTSEIKKLSPIDAKKAIASDLVTQIHSSQKAQEAQIYFEQTFQKKSPTFTKTVQAKPTLSTTISEISGSTSQAKRLIKEGAVDINGKTIRDSNAKVKKGDKIKIGKKHFLKAV